MVGIIVRKPDKDRWDRRVESTGHEEECAVLHMYFRRTADDGVSSDRKGQESEHDRTSCWDTVGNVSCNHGKDCCDGVRRDGEELSSDSGIAQTLDDGGYEKTEGVESSEDGKVGEGGEPCLD